MPDDDFGKWVFRGILVVIIIAFIALFGSMFFTIVPAGTVGVKDTFGKVAPDVFQPGFHFKNPFTRVVFFSVQTQKYYDPGSPGDTDVATITALSNEGLDVSMGIAVNYHIIGTDAPELYKTVGIHYSDVIMKPPVHSVPRDIISKYDVKTLYSAGQSASNPDRTKIEQELYDGISKGILDSQGNSRGIIIERVFIRNVELPKSLRDSIAAKLQQEQQIQTKAFEVQVAEKEAERKIAEAYGIAQANEIIANSLTSNYLKWYWVENQKTNPNVIYVVPSDDPFPLSLVKDIDNQPGVPGGWGTSTS